MTTSGLGSKEVTASNSLYRTRSKQGGGGTSFWPPALIEKVRAIVHAVAPIGYEDESGFYFGEQPPGRKRTAADQLDSRI